MKEIACANPETARAVEEYMFNKGQELAKAQEEVRTVVIEGSTYAVYGGKMTRIEQKNPPEPDWFEVFSLRGLVDFIKADTDHLFCDAESRHIVRVVNETMVDVVSPATGYERVRYVRARCVAHTPRISFGEFLDTDQFQVMLQTCFEPSTNRDTVMKLAGSASKEQSMRKSDDGMKQAIQVNTGVVTVQDVIIHNPVTLTPFRTFYEVEQPSSPFILRFDEDANAALYEGDGGAWKNEAVKRIADWLRWELANCNVEIIA